MIDHGPTRGILVTPVGAGAVAVIHLTGPGALAVARQTLRLLPDRPVDESSLPVDVIRRGRFQDNGEPVDEVVVCRLSGQTPRIVIMPHGGRRILERIFSTLSRHGATLETKVDPPSIWSSATAVEAQAMAAMVRAKSTRAVRFLAHQATVLPRRLHKLADRCEFDRDGVGAELRQMVRNARPARRLIQGVTIGLVGSPNSGKSTLFNALIGRPGAVVSDRPGTTRDWCSAISEIQGVAATFIDTAGWRSTGDPIESQAISQGWRALLTADIVIHLADSGAPLQIDPRFRGVDFPRVPVLRVRAKSDLGRCWQDEEWPLQPHDSQGVFTLSVHQEWGLDELRKGILEAMELSDFSDAEAAPFTDHQIEHIRRAEETLSQDPKSASAILRNLADAVGPGEPVESGPLSTVSVMPDNIDPSGDDRRSGRDQRV